MRAGRHPLRSLGDLQGVLGRALLGSPAPGVVSLIAADGIAPEARLDIYRHHVFASLTASLEATYPVVCRLLDRRFFTYAADAFIRGHLPAGPCLFEYGAELAGFLADFPASRHLEYLPDVARLEWALNVAAHADDAAPISPSALESVAPARVGELRFAFDPSLSLLRSPWPIDRIWRANQAEVGTEPLVNLTAGGVRLEIRRRDDVVGFRELTLADYILRRALLDGERLGTATEAARDVDPGLDLTGLLGALLQDNVLVGFSLSPGRATSA